MEEQSKLGFQTERKLETVEEYKFEPIKGYPMLHWKGKRPFTSTQYYPAQLKENHGEPVDGWMNRIYWGDNLQVMSHLLKEFRGKVDLVYIDPPFDSKAEYKKTVALKGISINNDQNVFEEKQYSDIWTNDAYLQYIYERLIILKELLSEKGSIYIHCDWHKSHLLRCIMDEVFGASCFVNEIIWKRSANTSSIGKIWKRAHDTIFHYVKTEEYTFNFQRKPLSEASLKIYSKEDDHGRYRIVPLLVSGKRYGETGKVWKGIDPNLLGKNGMHWVTKHSKLESYLNEEKIEWSKDGIPGLKYYLNENPGVVISDLWDDINLITSTGSESENYPTQKPEKLLERIIEASSIQGDMVLDCFMGSGTTQAVAMKLGRRFIGADINLGAIQTTTKRLINVARELQEQKEQKAQTEKQLSIAAEDELEKENLTFYTGFSVYNVNHYDIFRNPVQAKDILIQALEIQPLPGNTIYDGEKDGKMVKIMPINRISTRADLNDLITGFNYREFEKRQEQNPSKAVESLLLVCMGHEPDLGAMLQREVPFKLEVEVVDILRDKSNLEFKRDAEAKIIVEKDYIVIKQFYPMNLLQKLSMRKENVEDWKELVESVMIDFNYDGAIFEPTVVDVPEKNEMVVGRYEIPYGAGTIRVKITDLLSESLEVEVPHGR